MITDKNKLVAELQNDLDNNSSEISGLRSHQHEMQKLKDENRDLCLNLDVQKTELNNNKHK